MILLSRAFAIHAEITSASSWWDRLILDLLDEGRAYHGDFLELFLGLDELLLDFIKALVYLAQLRSEEVDRIGGEGVRLGQAGSRIPGVRCQSIGSGPGNP
ncbi:hypothetical protein B296_00003595 [Ensete ventricosum]|uniref:Uncharacterized protein n=1 Tax=Ensete ventricosum TaxID=4639 RepID=A0A427ALG8_ENSVE|nr:hypothetical protein B296_00003595 [Ensete ventricosum]